jgi:hypothetical protein
MAASMKFRVFWNVVLCSHIEGQLERDYTVLHPRRFYKLQGHIHFNFKCETIVLIYLGVKYFTYVLNAHYMLITG